MVEHLIIHETPSLRRPPLVAAFAGWPDASEGATGAVRYLTRLLGAKKFAEIDPEEFYDFTVTRPTVFSLPSGRREIRWPANEFYFWKNEFADTDLILFSGIEPNLHWRQFSAAMLSVVEQFQVPLVLGLGALLDSVPHTREPKITGSANVPHYRARLEGLGILGSSYQGPTGIHSALYEVCERRAVPLASIWGHAPHYIQGVTNPKVSLAILQKLVPFLELKLDLDELSGAADRFDAQIEAYIAGKQDIRDYVRRLEEQMDSAEGGERETPSADTLMKELEDFLRQQREQGSSNEPNSPPG